ncbi:flagellar biosynthetic protein FliO [Paenibacillus oryzisoli]|uniref:flagellar biosynthetic protein FliO n=1 Tax=Paenibacillus oryzisoli TaxID=1850517 RepID=UPI003D2E8853
MKRLQSKLGKTTLLFFSSLLTTGQLAMAETDNTIDQSPADFPSTLTGASSFFMIVKVIIVLVLIIVLFYVLMRYLARKNRGSMFGSSIRSLGGVPLGPNKSIQLVEIGHSILVVGVGDNIQMLDKITDAEEIAYITDLLQQSQEDRMGLASVSKWMGKLSGKKTVEEEEVELTASFQQVFHNKIQQVSTRNKQAQQWLSDQKQTDRLNDE